MFSRIFSLIQGPPPLPPLSLRIGLAILSTAAALYLGFLLAPSVGGVGPYLPLLAALVLSSWYGGVGPGLVTQVLGAAATFLFIARPQPFGAIQPSDFYGLVAFLISGKLILFLTTNLKWNAHLRQNKRDLEIIAHASHDSLWEWDFAGNRVHRNGNVRHIFGGSLHESPHDIEAWRQRLHPEDAERVWSSLRQAIENKTDQWEEEYRIRRNDGSYIFVSDRGRVIRNKAGKAVRMIGGLADVSAQRRAEDQLIYSASHDALTGLPNRECFLASIRHALASQQHENHKTIAVFFLDIDRFKVVNDSLGHAVGDQLLSAVAKRLKQCLRVYSIAARFGGDEFTVMLENVENNTDAASAADRIQSALATPFEFDGHHLVITVSIGIALAGKYDTPEDILRHADIAMYRAKSAGKARHILFEPAIDTSAKDLLQLESDLRQSLKQQRFHIYYQPIVSLSTGRIISFEALLRWEHPSRGLLLPSEFLSLAEEAGLIVPLGQWMLRESCRQLCRWHRQSSTAQRLSININLSEKQFLEPSLIDQVKLALDENHLDGRFVTLELTETMIMKNNEVTLARLRQLRNLGVKLAVDDFGKGYSSLGRLQDFPISIIKIDGSFTHRIEAEKSQIVDAIVALAHQLDLEVTAEGIETFRQFSHLVEAGCSSGQGFFFSAAIDQAEAFSLLQNEPVWSNNLPQSKPYAKFVANSVQ